MDNTLPLTEATKIEYDLVEVTGTSKLQQVDAGAAPRMGDDTWGFKKGMHAGRDLI